MNRFAIIAGVVLAALGQGSRAAEPPVGDASFNQEAEAVAAKLRQHEQGGVFGRAEGPVPAAEGRARRMLGDRDIDLYERRLAAEIRMMNARREEDSTGFR